MQGSQSRELDKCKSQKRKKCSEEAGSNGENLRILELLSKEKA